MHKPFLIVIAFTLPFWGGQGGAAQENLVLNPSFEDTAGMTIGFPYSFCNHWWSPNGFSSDYFSPHCEVFQDTYGTRCAPFDQNFGYQQAQDGEAYAGLDIYEDNNETKEYAQGYLAQPLAAGVTYCVRVWIVLADSSGYSSCDFQFAFTDELIQDAELGNLFLADYVDFNISGLNADNWTLHEGSYTAVGGEQFIYLGSNTPNDELTCIEPFSDALGGYNAAYILIDNVFVGFDEDCSSSVQLNEFVPFVIECHPNPCVEFLTVELIGIAEAECMIVDCFGKICLKTKVYQAEQLLDVSNLSAGSYIAIVQGNLQIAQQKFVVMK